MAVSARGSRTRSYRWLVVLLLPCALLGCGSDLPPDIGGGTISGRITYFGDITDSNNENSLVYPTLMILASYTSFEESLMFQSALMVLCRDFPEEGISYELKGLATGYSYHVYGAIADFGQPNWWKVYSIGGYGGLGQVTVEVTSTSAVTGIDIFLIDCPEKDCSTLVN